MKKYLAAIFLFTALPAAAQLAYSKYVVRFTDKNGTLHSLANPSTYLSAKAIARRNNQHIAIDSTDLPVSAAYVDSIRNVSNVTLLNQSKWLNQVVVLTTDPAALSKINAFPFVKTSFAVSARYRPGTENPVNQKFKESIVPIADQSLISRANNGAGTAGKTGTSSLNYGNSFNQIHLHEGEYLHDRGFTGEGITIAILDAGFFGYTTNAAMDSVRLLGHILGTWDYVANEASVDEDHPHGLYCFSIIAANKPGEIVGSAPHASFWLLRTEEDASEYPVEEDNWAAAAEAADSAGADMITSSLGYANFDDPIFNHSYAQRDGNTADVTIAADLAVKKGMIVTNSAGNSGNVSDDSKFVLCPGDGDSVYTVGATDINGNIASFSSWGPNGAGKLKPDGVSVGQNTILAATNGNASAGNGTSFSNPNLCGLIACLWQAFPEFTNMEITDAVRKSSSRFNNPDGRYGYGIPNFRIAFQLLEKERETRRIASLLETDFMRAYPVPFTTNLNVAVKAPESSTAVLRLTNALGQVVETKEVEMVNGQIYIVRFDRTAQLPRGVYFVSYAGNHTRRTISVKKQ